MTRWLSLILPQGLSRNRTSPPSLGVREYVHTYISHINKLSLTALSHQTHTLVETNNIQIKTYNIQIKNNSLTLQSFPGVEFDFREKNRKKSQVFMSHSITFHCVYFGLSTVPKRETIEGSRSWKSSPVFSRLLLLLSLYWFNSTPEPRMYRDHEGNRKGDISPSWGQVFTLISEKKIAKNRKCSWVIL